MESSDGGVVFGPDDFVDEGKYVVYKREDLAEFIKDLRAGLVRGIDAANLLEDKALPDSVVLRLKDEFAGPALHAYAANVATVARLADAIDLDRVSQPLMDLADTFERFAERADEIAAAGDAKLPD